MGVHSEALEALGAIATIGFLGFIGGYFGAVVTILRRPDLRLDPIEAGGHGSAWVGLLAVLVVLTTVLR